MITLETAEEMLHAPFRVLPKVTPDDEKLSRILDVAEFYRWKNEPTGGRTAWVQMVKPLPGIPAGMLIELSALHEVLFGTPLKRPN
jgi:hypothetical protein